MMGNQVKSLSSRDFQGGGGHGEKAHDDQQAVPDPVLNPPVNAQKIDMPPVDHAAHQHGADNAGQKDKIVNPNQLQRCFLGFVCGDAPGFLPVMVKVQKKINHQQQTGDGQHVGHNCKCPEK